MNENRKKQIRIEAEHFRRNCKINNYKILDLFAECERCGYKLIRYPLGDSGILGFTIKRDSDTVIFTNTSSRLARELFTLAHEIGHVILHSKETIDFFDDMVTIANKNVNEKEQEANYFAICLLMPEDEVNKFLDLEVENFPKSNLTAMDIARIMSEFNVSFETALNRLENLDKIKHGERVNLDNTRNVMRVGKLLRSVGGNAKLNESCKIIDIPRIYMDYVIYNYNHGAVPKKTLERVLDCYELVIEDVSDRLLEPVMDEDDDLAKLIGGLDD